MSREKSNKFVCINRSEYDPIYDLETAFKEWRTKTERYGHRCLFMQYNPTSPGVMYYVARIPTLLSMVKQNNVYHEGIISEIPCRLFLDVELKEGESNTTNENVIFEGKTRLTKILEVVNITLKKLDFKGETHHIELSGSRPGKFSAHVTFPDVWFQSPAHLLSFYETANLDAIVDRSPLLRCLGGQPTFLRMPYAMRVVKDGNGEHVEVPRSELIPVGKKDNWLFNKEIFFQACISSVLEIPKTAEFVKIKPYIKPDRRFKTKIDSNANVRLEPVVNYILDYIGLEGGKIMAVSDDSWTVIGARGAFCPGLFKQKDRLVHERNGSRVQLWRDKEAKLRISIFCLDPECKKHVWNLDEDFTYMYTSILKQL